MHIIIARYNESIEWVQDLYPHITYTIYNKGMNNIPYPSVNVPNVGRESETYLRYIVENYHSIPDTVCFCQGAPNGHCHPFVNLVNDYIPTKPSLGNGIFPLGLPVISKINEVSGKIHGTPVKDFISDCMPEYLEIKAVEWVYGAQYIVNKKFILNKSLEWWKLVYSLHTKYMTDGGSILGSPWLFERMWILIWNYEKK